MPLKAIPSAVAYFRLALAPRGRRPASDQGGETIRPASLGCPEIPLGAGGTYVPGMATDARRPAGPTVIRSDQGVRYGSWASTRRARDADLLPSMGAVGTCSDNAMMESFWSRVQVELLYWQAWSARLELATAL